MDLSSIVALIRRNEQEKFNPLGIDGKSFSEWAKGLEIAKGGEVVFYTGGLYQIAPHIDLLVSAMKMVPETMPKEIVRIGERFSLPIGRIVGKKKQDRFNKIVRRIFLLVRDRIPDIGYLWDEESYSGALYYDIGMDFLFREHAERIVEAMRRNGVRTVITIDPHTHHILKDIFPKYTKADFEIKYYMELLDMSIPLEGYVVHDPCYLVRWSGLLDVFRRVISGVGEPDESGITANCCGGPIESIFPEMAESLAKKRIEELVAVSRKIVTACPICLVNLWRVCEKYEAQVQDVAEVLEVGL